MVCFDVELIKVYECCGKIYLGLYFFFEYVEDCYFFFDFNMFFEDSFFFVIYVMDFDFDDVLEEFV